MVCPDSVSLLFSHPTSGPMVTSGVFFLCGYSSSQRNLCYSQVKQCSLAAGIHLPSFPQCSSWGYGQAAGAWDHIQQGYSLEAKVLLSNPLMEVPEAFFNLSHWQGTLASWFRGILLCVAGPCSIILHPVLSASKEMNLPFNGGAGRRWGCEAQKIFF